MAHKTLEAKLTDELLGWLKEKASEGAPLYWEHRSGSVGWSYKMGVPDLWVSANGHHLEIELKAPNGKLSAAQEKFSWRCRSSWNIPHIVPRTLKEATDFIESYLPGPAGEKASHKE